MVKCKNFAAEMLYHNWRQLEYDKYFIHFFITLKPLTTIRSGNVMIFMYEAIEIKS